LVKSSSENVLPDADGVAAMFYGTLFKLDPSLRDLFRGGITEQGRKLVTMLHTAVAGLDDLDAIAPAMQQLGVRHARYGVSSEDYATVGAALIWTLGQRLGDGFTDEVKDAWTEDYTLLAKTMKDAAGRVAA
jgi:hemoglobin-like flavoprotein